MREGGTLGKEGVSRKACTLGKAGMPRKARMSGKAGMPRQARTSRKAACMHLTKGEPSSYYTGTAGVLELGESSARTWLVGQVVEGPHGASRVHGSHDEGGNGAVGNQASSTVAHVPGVSLR